MARFYDQFLRFRCRKQARVSVVNKEALAESGDRVFEFCTRIVPIHRCVQSRRIDAVRIGEAKDSKAAASGDATWLLYARSNQQLSFDIDHASESKLVADKNSLRETLTFRSNRTQNGIRSRYLSSISNSLEN